MAIPNRSAQDQVPLTQEERAQVYTRPENTLSFLSKMAATNPGRVEVAGLADIVEIISESVKKDFAVLPCFDPKTQRDGVICYKYVQVRDTLVQEIAYNPSWDTTIIKKASSGNQGGFLLNLINDIRNDIDAKRIKPCPGCKDKTVSIHSPEGVFAIDGVRRENKSDMCYVWCYTCLMQGPKFSCNVAAARNAWNNLPR